MQSLDQLNRELQTELTRVGGGFLRLEFYATDTACQLFVHEGSELGDTPWGTVYWHAWEGAKFDKQELLDVLKTWPTFAEPRLDARVGIWFAEYRRQTNRKTGQVRWKDVHEGDAHYPDIFPWEDLEKISN